MNAVEIEQAVSELAEAPFDEENFPFLFLEAFGNKATTIKRLRTGTTNKSDVGGVLQTNNIHLKVCSAGAVSDTLNELRNSPATTKGKAKFTVATDGNTFEAEDLTSGETVACDYLKFPDHFGFFLPLAGISTVKQIRESAFDIKATGRLNRLYVQLLKDNPKWGQAEKQEEMNHFMARLIFCFFAEDTDIFKKPGLFTDTIDRMSESDASNTHEIIMELFRSMNTKFEEREAAKVARWANELPYVNGGLFAGSLEVPRFTRIARSYLLHIGNLDWKKINPDIFGSMIQAVADEDERGELGMHYTSVPNILKVLNPLFLDELREQLEEAGNNARKLLNLRNRMAKIRVFDPACGSGNFLVIAYKEMRAIEAEINKRRDEQDQRSVIPLTNFRGIELRQFAAEVARLALIIAEYQCDVMYRGQKEAIRDFLPLRVENWITCANALRIDWLSVCPPTGKDVKHRGDDLFNTPLDQAEIDFQNEGGETYICGNPPYLGSRWRNEEQQKDLADLFAARIKSYKDLDYVAAWYLKAFDYLSIVSCATCAFVATKSICQGEQVAMLWPTAFKKGIEIVFAYRPFHWSNLASHNASVTVVVVGVSRQGRRVKQLYEMNAVREVSNIGPYLIPTDNVIVKKSSKSLNGLPRMDYGNKPTDGGNLLLTSDKAREVVSERPSIKKFIKYYVGSIEFIQGTQRFCFWVEDSELEEAQTYPELKKRFHAVRKLRTESKGQQANANAGTPHRFVFAPHKSGVALIVPRVSSERRPYLPAGLVDDYTIVSDRAAVIYNPDIWLLAMIVSRMHLVWIATVCVRMRMDFSYSNTLGWNTFPVPTLTE